ADALVVLAVELDAAPDRGAQIDEGVRARHAYLYPAGQPRRACLRASARRRSDPLRRQYLTLGAGGRTRHERVERAHPAGNARPYQISAHRRASLSGDAAALRLFLVLLDERSKAGTGKGAAPGNHHIGARA